ncbi:hypothetical protein D915_004221 [Fasciola hepatica]|uniref:Uncharacterized protein n=1 Tax=Fasciola hepatica TaxID=6192 RepID=A0A4E0RCJ8_FASHE|nr:hypothetical protein D915_004221 [Fasciola hepatica]
MVILFRPKNYPQYGTNLFGKPSVISTSLNMGYLQLLCDFRSFLMWCSPCCHSHHHPIFQLQKQKKAAQVLIDCPELVNIDLDPSQLETLSNESQLITMTCSIPLYHHASSTSECAKPHMSSPSRGTAGSQHSVLLQQDLDACVNLKAYYLCVKRMVRMMQNTTFLQNRNMNSDILKNGKQILEYRRSYPRSFSLPKSVNPVQHFVRDVALKAFHGLLTNVHRLVTRQSQLSITKSDASKFLRGVRIVRILERALSRLMKDHATLFASLLMGSTSYQKVLPLTEPVLSLEQQCCREFIRLCLECTLNRYERIVSSVEEHPTTGRKRGAIHIN